MFPKGECFMMNKWFYVCLVATVMMFLAFLYVLFFGEIGHTVIVGLDLLIMIIVSFIIYQEKNWTV